MRLSNDTVVRAAVLPLCMLILAVLAGACAREQANEQAARMPFDSAVQQFNQRRIYRSLDSLTLTSIPDAKLEQAVMDYVFTKLEGKFEREALVLAALPAGTRALYLTWVVESEVNNGGFNQYFWNTNGQYTHEVVGAFEFFGATEHAKLMQQAVDMYYKEQGHTPNRKQQRTADGFARSYERTKLNVLDDRFYTIQENLSVKRIARIRATPQLFAGD